MSSVIVPFVHVYTYSDKISTLSYCLTLSVIYFRYEVKSNGYVLFLEGLYHIILLKWCFGKVDKQVIIFLIAFVFNKMFTSDSSITFFSLSSKYEGRQQCWFYSIFYLNRIRLISLASQKFISDIANDALQYCKMKGTASGSSRSKTKVSWFRLPPQICSCQERLVFKQFSLIGRIRSTLWRWRTWLLLFLSTVWMSRNLITSLETLSSTLLLETPFWVCRHLLLLNVFRQYFWKIHFPFAVWHFLICV